MKEGGVCGWGDATRSVLYLYGDDKSDGLGLPHQLYGDTANETKISEKKGNIFSASWEKHPFSGLYKMSITSNRKLWRSQHRPDSSLDRQN